MQGAVDEMSPPFVLVGVVAHGSKLVVVSLSEPSSL